MDSGIVASPTPVLPRDVVPLILSMAGQDLATLAALSLQPPHAARVSQIVASASTLTDLPPGLNEFTRLEGRNGALAVIRRQSAAATGRALADGKQLLEIEFPPLLETKTQFDDFTSTARQPTASLYLSLKKVSAVRLAFRQM